MHQALGVPAKIRWGHLGELTVTVDGRPIFSNRITGRLPTPGEIPHLLKPS